MILNKGDVVYLSGCDGGFRKVRILNDDPISTFCTDKRYSFVASVRFPDGHSESVQTWLLYSLEEAKKKLIADRDRIDKQLLKLDNI